MSHFERLAESTTRPHCPEPRPHAVTLTGPNLPFLPKQTPNCPGSLRTPRHAHSQPVATLLPRCIQRPQPQTPTPQYKGRLYRQLYRPSSHLEQKVAVHKPGSVAQTNQLKQLGQLQQQQQDAATPEHTGGREGVSGLETTRTDVPETALPHGLHVLTATTGRHTAAGGTSTPRRIACAFAHTTFARVVQTKRRCGLQGPAPPCILVLQDLSERLNSCRQLQTRNPVPRPKGKWTPRYPPGEWRSGQTPGCC